MTRKQLERWYDFLYHKADEIFKEYNPCGITKTTSCIETKGIEYDLRSASKTRDKNDKGCCYECKYLSKNGCTVKALRCKLYTCPATLINLHNKNPIAHHQLNRLKMLAYRLDLMRGPFRECKRDTLKKAWFYHLHDYV